MYLYAHTHVHVSIYMLTCAHTRIVYALCIGLLSATMYNSSIKQKNKPANTDLPIFTQI